MSDGSSLKLVLLAVTVALSAFFSGSEAAFLSVQRSRLLHLINRKVPGAHRVTRLLEHPERLLSTVLLGNNLVNTAAAALGTALAIELIGDAGVAVAVATAGVTTLLLVVGEVTPKVIAARRAEGVAILMARPIELFGLLLLPLARGLELYGRLVSRLVGGSARAMVTQEEIEAMIVAGRLAGAVDQTEAEMLAKVFRFGDRQVREVMTPRTEMVAVQEGTTMAQFLALYQAQPFSRYPVIRQHPDNVVGILSVRDVLAALAGGNLRSSDPVTPLARAPVFYPEAKTVGQLFAEMRQQGQSAAILVDEFGGVAGMVTLKQLLEEIVGPVGEEGAPAPEEFAAIDENTYEVEAAMGVAEVNEKMALGLPEGDYETLAGFILERLGHIPRVGEHFHFRDLRFEVTAMDGMRIQRVRVQRVLRSVPPQGRPS